MKKSISVTKWFWSPGQIRPEPGFFCPRRGFLETCVLGVSQKSVLKMSLSITFVIEISTRFFLYINYLLVISYFTMKISITFLLSMIFF